MMNGFPFCKESFLFPVTFKKHRIKYYNQQSEKNRERIIASTSLPSFWLPAHKPKGSLILKWKILKQTTPEVTKVSKNINSECSEILVTNFPKPIYQSSPNMGPRLFSHLFHGVLLFDIFKKSLFQSISTTWAKNRVLPVGRAPSEDDLETRNC